jgi:hypothetical protein
MRYFKTHIILSLLMAVPVFAQEANVASGGNASGSEGIASYTVGQVIYTTHFESTVSVSQGVQQAFEIQTVLSLPDHHDTILLSVYPNPTQNILTLDIQNISLEALQYQLFDLQGRLLRSGKIIESQTFLSLEILPAATYLLQVLDASKEVKTFKIIKN